MSDPLNWAEETEQGLLSAMLAHAPSLGWSRAALAAGAGDIGLSQAEAELLAPNGPRDLAALLAERHDRLALAALGDICSAGLKVRERIRLGIMTRCDIALRDEPATRRWIGFLALPANVPLALRLNWASADALWRWAGDRATDENHYTKRLLLGGILTSTLAVRLAMDVAAASDHLEARIDAVMAFERWKAGLKPADLAGRLAAGLGRLRYGRP